MQRLSVKRTSVFFFSILSLVLSIFIGLGDNSFAEDKNFSDDNLVKNWTFKSAKEVYTAKVVKKDNKKIFEVIKEEEDDTPVYGNAGANFMGSFRGIYHMTVVETLCKDANKNGSFYSVMYQEKIKRPNGNVISMKTETLLSDFQAYLDKKLTKKEFQKKIKKVE